MRLLTTQTSWCEVSGVQQINQNIQKVTQIYCDHTTDSGGLFEV